LKKLLELRARKAEAVSALKTLLKTADTEKRSLSDEESTKFDTLKTEAEDLTVQIQRSEYLVKEERSLIGDSENINETDAPTNDELRTFVMTGDQRSLSSGVNADGGFTVIPSIDKTIYKLLTDSSVFRQNASVQTISTQKWEKLVSVGGTSAGWADETDARGETNTSELKKVTVDLHTLYAFPKTTQELLDWSDFDVSGWLSSEVAQEMGEKENTSFWYGDGSKKPTGLLTYDVAATDDGVRAFGTIQQIETETIGAIDGDDLITFAHKLRRAYRASAKYYMNDATLETVRKIKDTDGNYLWRAGILEGEASTILGKPVEIDEAIEDDFIVYGDLSRAYKILDHTSGTRMIRDNITVPGWVKMLTSRYVGGGIVDSNAVKFLKVKES
jgi:HK97 family phage major capsid protein